MTGQDRKERAALGRLVEALVEDVLQAPNEDILSEFRDKHGDADQFAAAMRGHLEKQLIAVNKSRMQAAKAGLARDNTRVAATSVVGITDARARLRRFLASDAARANLTMAARKEDELSDQDVCGMLEDLQDMGLLTPDSDGR